MEDVLDVYQRSYDPLNPVVCIDETNKQLIVETRIPCASGQSEKVDYEYERNGVADVFMISEPLAGKRETIVTETRTAVDFAAFSALRTDPVLKAFYDTKRSQGKIHSVTMGHLCRKMISIVFAILRDNKPYVPALPSQFPSCLFIVDL